MLRAVLHGHSTYSDGWDKPVKIAKSASDLGINLIALTDHNTTAGLSELFATCEKLRLYEGKNIYALAGIEVTTDGGDVVLITKTIDLKFNNWIENECNSKILPKIGYIINKAVKDFDALVVFVHPGANSVLSSVNFSFLQQFAKKTPDEILQNCAVETANWSSLVFGQKTVKRERAVFDLATKYNYAIVASSDYHFAQDLDKQETIVPVDKESVANCVSLLWEAIKTRKTYGSQSQTIRARDFLRLVTYFTFSKMKFDILGKNF